MYPLRAHSQTEAMLYLKASPCRDCSQGPLELIDQAAEGSLHRLAARCARCGAECELAFIWPQPEPPGEAPAQINPTDQPSRIIDAGQWLSLYYLLIESAVASEEDKAAKRRLTAQAGQCLDEALKFYTEDDELPPESAFFTDSSRHAYAEHPERFARQKLRDMRAPLPEMRSRPRRPADKAAAEPKRPWWRPWKR